MLNCLLKNGAVLVPVGLIFASAGPSRTHHVCWFLRCRDPLVCCFPFPESPLSLACSGFAPARLVLWTFSQSCRPSGVKGDAYLFFQTFLPIVYTGKSLLDKEGKPPTCVFTPGCFFGVASPRVSGVVGGGVGWTLCRCGPLTHPSPACWGHRRRCPSPHFQVREQAPCRVCTQPTTELESQFRSLGGTSGTPAGASSGHEWFFFVKFTFLFNIFFGCAPWLVGSQFPHQALNPRPVQWKHRVLTIRESLDVSNIGMLSLLCLWFKAGFLESRPSGGEPSSTPQQLHDTGHGITSPMDREACSPWGLKESDTTEWLNWLSGPQLSYM